MIGGTIMQSKDTLIGKPIRCLQTMLRVVYLCNGVPCSMIPDGIYGPETLAAVTAFQREHALPVTGITDQKTWDAVVEAYEDASIQYASACPLQIDMQPGESVCRESHSPHIPLIQSMLSVLENAFHCIGAVQINGIWDDLTEDAVGSFQQICGLTVTGKLDKCTWKHLAMQYPLAASKYPERLPNYS